MAFRDRVTLMSSRAPGECLSFRPDSGINWLLRNIDSNGKSRLFFRDAATSLSVEIESALKGIHRKNEIFHCSNQFYYLVCSDESTKNILVAEDGFVSRQDGKGDTLVQKIEQKARGERLRMRPPAGQEWVIHTVMSRGAFDLYKTGPAGSIFSKRIHQRNSALTGLHLYCTNSVWWEIEQLNAGNVIMGYDGVRVL